MNKIFVKASQSLLALCVPFLFMSVAQAQPYGYGGYGGYGGGYGAPRSAAEQKQSEFCQNNQLISYQQCMQNFRNMERSAGGNPPQQNRDWEWQQRQREREQRDRWERERWEREQYNRNNYPDPRWGYNPPQRGLSENQQRILNNCQFLPPGQQQQCRAAVLNSR